MKYLRIKFTNHPILGDLELDLRDGNGNPYDTIVIAGENGVGKTVLLNEIFSVDMQKQEGKQGTIDADIELSDDEINDVATYARTTLQNDIYDNLQTNFFHLNFNFDEQNIMYNGRVTFDKNDGTEGTDRGIAIRSVLKNVYSNVGINFNPDKTNTVTSKTLDVDNITKDQSKDNLATEIKQLFIDINASDASELEAWVMTHPGEIPPEVVKRPRMKRFTNAFNTIFPSKRLKEITTVNGGKDVVFEENNRTMSIDVLSSGEKQIVFRGAFMLKNKNTQTGCVALVDEPEISMHPKWEMKILDYFKGLFYSNETNSQVSQLFVATHSEYVIKSALSDMAHNLVIILKKNDQGGVNASRVTAPVKLQQITSAEVNYLAFGVYSTDYHIQLYGALQYREGLDTIKDCDNYIMNTPEFIADTTRYALHSSYQNPRSNRVTDYETLPTYIRNAIDHPNSGNTYTDDQLALSIDFLRSLL